MRVTWQQEVEFYADLELADGITVSDLRQAIADSDLTRDGNRLLCIDGGITPATKFLTP